MSPPMGKKDAMTTLCDEDRKTKNKPSVIRTGINRNSINNLIKLFGLFVEFIFEHRFLITGNGTDTQYPDYGQNAQHFHH